MADYDYLSSLKNKEFLILQKLCDPSLSKSKKEELEKELKFVRLDIDKLG